MKRVLVVATAPVDQQALRSRLRETAGDGAEIKVVAPASDVSPLQWLATDEDDARGEAAAVARGAEQAVEPEAERVDAEVGDSDPVQAIEDALRTFPGLRRHQLSFWDELLALEWALRGVSSAGRAPALQAGGRRFDPGTLHR